MDIQLLFVACAGAIQHKIFFMNEAVTEHFLEALVDMLLYGVTTSSPGKPTRVLSKKITRTKKL